MDAEDIAQVEHSLRQALTADPRTAVAAVTEFGWAELLAAEPDVAIGTLTRLWGELLAHGTLLDAVLLAAGGFSDLPAGTRILLPALGSHRSPGSRTRDGHLSVDGVLTPPRDDAAPDAPVLVPIADGATVVFALTTLTADTAADPLDRAAGFTRVRRVVEILASVPRADGAATWQVMVAAGRRALAGELVGVVGAMKDMTVDHVRSREQFGQALGSFQAVKHQLADVALWHEVAALAVDAAWEDGGVESAALAKAAAVRAAHTARKACQQLLGGMGFTDEHDFHHYLRRALTLEPLLGGAADLHTELGAAVRAGTISDALVAL